MKGALKIRLPNDLWLEIDKIRESGTRNNSLVEAIHLADMEIVRKMEAFGLNRSDRKQGRRFFRHDLILLNGHPSQDNIEALHKATQQASDEYRTSVYSKHIRLMLNREDGK